MHAFNPDPPAYSLLQRVTATYNEGGEGETVVFSAIIVGIEWWADGWHYTLREDNGAHSGEWNEYQLTSG